MPVIKFIEFDGTEHEVDADDGMSIMEVAMKYDIPGIDAVAPELPAEVRRVLAGIAEDWIETPRTGGGEMIATMIMSEMPISTPGTTPARNSRPIDTSALTP